jgi:hypothetical protein
MPRAFTDEEIDKILLEHRYVLKADETCAKWGISRGTLRKWKRERGPVCAGLRELLIWALLSGPIRYPARIANWLDYMNHDIYTPREIRAALNALVRQGIAARTANGWRYRRRRTSFLF